MDLLESELEQYLEEYYQDEVIKMMKYIGEISGKVYPRWLENYMWKRKIPDVALELRENRLIAHAVVV